MLELVFTSSYFVFDQKLYKQLLGLFMGCKPSPIGAIVRVYMFERRSVYVDPYYLSIESELNTSSSYQIKTLMATLAGKSLPHHIRPIYSIPWDAN